MSEFLKKYPIFITVVLITMFFFTVVRPLIEAGVEESKVYTDKAIFEHTNPKLDSIIIELRESNKLLRGEVIDGR